MKLNERDTLLMLLESVGLEMGDVDVESELQGGERGLAAFFCLLSGHETGCTQSDM